MAKKEHYFTRFEEERIYHVYNRTIDRKPMFTSDENYAFFIRQFDKYLSDYVNIYAYNLIGNHFHFMIQIKDLSNLTNLTTFKKLSNLEKEKTTHDIVSHQFKKFFQSYAMAFNKQQNRIGTLFQTPFKRVEVNNEEYLRELICYIHTNAQKHKIVKDFREWKWTSYHKISSDKETKLIKTKVIDYFNDKENFEYTHLLYAKKNEEKERDFFIED